MPQKHVFEAVLRAARLLPGYPKLRVLDLSAGRGEIAAALAGDGCDVRGTHFRADDYKLAEEPPSPGIAIDPDVDLTRPLPYGSAAFDLAILCEVAEHLPTYIPVIAEIGRVLAPSGHLILSTPNVARLHSRWHFFWTGTHKLIRRRVGWDLTPDDLYAYHITPVDFPLLHTLLRQAGLSVERLEVTRFKWKHAWMLLLYPLIAATTWVEMRKEVENEAQRTGVRDLRRWMLHPAMLASEQLMVLARKS